MQQTLVKIYEFVENVKEHAYVLTDDIQRDPENYRKFSTVSIRIDELEVDKLTKKLKLREDSKALNFIIEMIESNFKIKLTDEQKLIFYLPEQLSWTREAQKEGEYLLKGGTYFNGIMDVISSKPTTFFEYSLDKFLKYEDESKTDIELIRKLRFIESPTSLQDATYTPYFGCVTLKEGEFPNEFYFYDSGLVYKLPFTTYEDYIDALIQSAAVNCWQYFYINPEEIVSKNKGVKYITWGLHTRTSLDEDLAGLFFVPDAKYDRLDLINEHLEQCVKLLPGSFPFLKFEHHIQYYNHFKKLYEGR